MHGIYRHPGILLMQLSFAQVSQCTVYYIIVIINSSSHQRYQVHDSLLLGYQRIV